MLGGFGVGLASAARSSSKVGWKGSEKGQARPDLLEHTQKLRQNTNMKGFPNHNQVFFLRGL